MQQHRLTIRRVVKSTLSAHFLRSGNGPWLVVAVATATVLRFAGLGSGRPFVYHPDEHNLAFRALDAAAQTGNPGWFEYPSLMLYLLWPIYGLFYLVSGSETPAAFFRLYERSPFPFHFLGRGLVAVMGVATIPLAAAIGRAVAASDTQMVSQLAALLLAVSVLHVRDSHFLTVDIPSAFFATLSLYFCLRGAEDSPHARRWQTAAAVTIGLAAGCKYTCALLVVVLALGHARAAPDRRMVPAVLALGRRVGLVLLVFLVTTPYALLDAGTFLHDLRYQIYTTRGPALYGGTSCGVLVYCAHMWWGLGHGVVLLALLGASACILRRTPQRVLLVVWVGLFLAALALAPRAWARWLLPVVPALCVLAALGVEDVTRRLSGRLRGTAMTSLALAAIGANLAIDIPLLRLMKGTDTRSDAHAWMTEHIPRGTRVWQTLFGPPPVPGMDTLVDTAPVCDRPSFDLGTPHAPSVPVLEDLLQQGYAIFVLSQYATAPVEWPWVRRRLPWAEKYADFYARIRQQGELLAAFHAGQREVPIDAEDIYARHTYLRLAERPGPSIWVYRITAPQ